MNNVFPFLNRNIWDMFFYSMESKCYIMALVDEGYLRLLDFDGIT